MKVVASSGTPDIAIVYIAEIDGKHCEFVEALQPPYTRDERWILMVSTLFGCPVKCKICDAGGKYSGKPTAEQILSQIDYMVDRWYPDRHIPAKKFKIQFARMGEPALNMAVLEALSALPGRYSAPGLMPSVSTIAPHGTDAFFEKLIVIKDEYYPGGRFQFQFSLHTTDERFRRELIPVRTWSFSRMAVYADRFLKSGDRKITLNFALTVGSPIDVDTLRRFFDPTKFLIKITPVNPTCSAVQSGLVSYLDPHNTEGRQELVAGLINAGYEVIVSIGEVKENLIGSNCGQYVLKYLEGGTQVIDGYKFNVSAVDRAK